MNEAPTQKRDRREYFKQSRARSTDIYFADTAELQSFRDLAAQDGYVGKKFSAWVVQQLHNATTGHLYPEGYVEGLQKEVEKLRAREEVKDQQIAEQNAEIKNLLRQVADLRGIVRPLARGHLLHETETPREVRA